MDNIAKFVPKSQREEQNKEEMVGLFQAAMISALEEAIERIKKGETIDLCLLELTEDPNYIIETFVFEGRVPLIGKIGALSCLLFKLQSAAMACSYDPDVD